MTTQNWSIQEVVRISGTTSRTLRHYQRVGLLSPCRTASAGQRFYDREGLLRLQRILILRQLGLGVKEIGRVLDDGLDTVEALREHVASLEQERRRLDSVTASVRATITMIEEGGELVADTMFNGFDHTQYKDEVEQKWGRKAYSDADAWWRSLSADEKQTHHDEVERLVADFAEASKRGLDVGSAEVQALARRQYDWVRIGWGGTPPGAEAFIGLGQMYVDDPRFGKTYSADGRNFAGYVRDAMTVYAEENLA